MNELKEQEIKRILYILIAVGTCIRIIVAATLELSVDEVYYWTYALYPDWSHFDHPPMVGFVIQLFSFNLLIDSELAIRFGAIVFSIFNTLIAYSIGKSIKNPLAGLYAAFLLNASIYCSVLAGTFIIPDTPQLFFWLLSLKFLLVTLPRKTIDHRTSKEFLLGCLFIGFAIISKYHGIFIWVGSGVYVLLFNRNWLKTQVFYWGAILSALFITPIIIWNIQNNWISFTFHGDRVVNEFVIRPDYFFTEIIGQIAYNNPINYIIIIIALNALFRGKISINGDYAKILLLNSLPIWLVFTAFSLFRQTLPHWTGPAFTPLLFISAVYLSDKSGRSALSNTLFPKPLRSSIFLLLTLLVMAWSIINYYPGTLGKKDTISKYGDTDFTLDMFGWNQLSEGFKEIVKKDVERQIMPLDAAIVSPKYFPGTEIDYYIARPLGKKVFQLGSIKDIHKYAWINEERGGLKKGEDAYMISTSNWYKDPNTLYQDYFKNIVPSDTIEIKRSGKLAYYAFVYQLQEYNGTYPDPFNN